MATAQGDLVDAAGSYAEMLDWTAPPRHQPIGRRWGLEGLAGLAGARVSRSGPALLLEDVSGGRAA